MDSGLFGFSPEVFEQFVRALALRIFGPGLSVFGNGPDGGREASFRGTVPFPHPPAAQWSGYGVIQAKCKEGAETAAANQRWALRQLKSELERFADAATGRIVPEYYIFATNVTLSSTQGGGRDQAEQMVLSFAESCPLKGFAMWDSTQLEALVTQHEDLRRQFRFQLTPGDVLAIVFGEGPDRRWDMSRLLAAALERELRGDESARLEQAGKRTDDRLHLAQLFFDLPAAPEQRLEAPAEEPDREGHLPAGVLAELLSNGARRLDPRTLHEQPGRPEDPRVVAAHVLLGGPGSGKSTLMQVLAQVHRAALLSRRPEYTLLPETRQIIQETRSLCEREQLGWPATPRYPFRIDLNRFAKALSAESERHHVQSLDRYILNLLSPEETLGNTDLLDVLVNSPCLLILDGFDEVPVASNREQLVNAVTNLLATCTQIGADLQIVATSRHLGYAGGYGPRDVTFRHLLPLSFARALRYIERYANACYGISDPGRARDIVDHVRRSDRDSATAQLMSSPLQVTFVATVIAARGEPSSNRWKLFDSYYRTIYDRERQKAVPPYDEVLSAYDSVIERLHHDVGFWLQYTGETAAGLAVSLSLTDFATAVNRCLKERGHEPAEIERIGSLIVAAAHERLVFLTSTNDGQLAFEVRSLQEYMAAQCLTSGIPEDVSARLRAITHSAYWRNVFLLSAGRCFADNGARHLQDAISMLCAGVDEEEGAASIARSGAELALDVLESGAVAHYPIYARHFASLALPLTAMATDVEVSPDATFARRLIRAWRPALDVTYEQGLELLAGQSDIGRAESAWPVVLDLAARGSTWAQGLARRLLPDSSESRARILWQTVRVANCPDDIARQLESAVFRTPVSGFTDLAEMGDPSSVSSCFPAIRAFKEILGVDITTTESIEGSALILSFTSLSDVRRIFGSLERLRDTDAHPSWLPLTRLSEFMQSPGCDAAADYLEACAAGGTEFLCSLAGQWLWSLVLPWPLGACFDVARSRGDFQRLARAMRERRMGDIEDWQIAEGRWRSRSLALAEILAQNEERLPFDAAIADRGWPMHTLNFGTTSGGSGGAVDLLMRVPAQRLSELCLFGPLHSVAYRREGPDFSPDALRALIERQQEQGSGLPLRLESDVGMASTPAHQQWLEFHEWLAGQSLDRSRYRMTSSSFGASRQTWATHFEAAWIADTTRTGLLRNLAWHAATGGYEPDALPEWSLEPARFADPKARVAALVLLLARRQRVVSSEVLVSQLLHAVDSGEDADAMLLLSGVLRAHVSRAQGIEEVLVSLWRQRSGEPTWRGLLQPLLRRTVRERASALQGPQRLQLLKLPELVPLHASENAMRSENGGRPVRA